MKKLYLFDFDGTLTYEDTMFLFLKFYDAKKFYIEFIKHIPLFVLLKLKLAKAEEVKKSFISSVLKGQRKNIIEKKSQNFYNKFHSKIIRPNALAFIDSIDRSQTESYIVSASLDIWIKPFADNFNMKLLATKAEFKEGVFTGNFIGKNCNGPEKRCRIIEEFADRPFDKTIAFGDTDGDKAMMGWADESHFKFFH